METQTASFGVNQSQVFQTQARFIVAMGGTRGGKTTIGAYWTYNEMTKMREEITAAGAKLVPPEGFITSPTYDQLKSATLSRFFKEFPSIKQYYREYKREIIVPIYKEKGKVIYSTTYCRSLEEPDHALKGGKTWFIWMDEADGADEYAFDVAQLRVTDTIGKILITSTIYRNSWINRKIYQGIKSGHLNPKDWAIITWPSNENPSFPKSEWERLKLELDPIIFAREFESKFIFETGLVYGNILNYGIIDKIPNGVKILATFYSIDYGLNDPTVIMIVGYGSDSCWYVLNEYVKQMMDVSEINDVLNSYLEIYRPIYGDPYATYYDPAGGVAVLSINPDVFPIAAKKDIPSTVTLIRNFIYQRRLYILSHNKNLIKEISTYAFDPIKHIPVDRENHSTDALGYAIKNGWPSVDGLSEIEPPIIKNRIILDLEKHGMMDKGIFIQPDYEQNNFLL
jgi:hypothetical protein